MCREFHNGASRADMKRFSAGWVRQLQNQIFSCLLLHQSVPMSCMAFLSLHSPWVAVQLLFLLLLLAFISSKVPFASLDLLLFVALQTNTVKIKFILHGIKQCFDHGVSLLFLPTMKICVTLSKQPVPELHTVVLGVLFVCQVLFPSFFLLLLSTAPFKTLKGRLPYIYFFFPL